MSRREMVSVFTALLRWTTDKSQRAVIVMEAAENLYGQAQEYAEERNLFWNTWEDCKREQAQDTTGSRGRTA